MICVLQVNTGKELEVRKNLLSLGIKAIVPLGCIYKKLKSGWTLEEKVIFKGYVFVDIIYDADTYYKLIGVDNVIRLLRSGETPLKLSFKEEEELLLLDLLAKEPTKLKEVGGKHEVVGGLLESFVTRVEKIDKHKRCATVLIDLVEETHKVVLAVDIV